MAEPNPIQQRLDRLVRIASAISGGVAAHRVPTEKDMTYIVEMSSVLLDKLDEKARQMGTAGDKGYTPPKPRPRPELPS